MAMSFETMTICATALIVGWCGFRGFVRFCACGAEFTAKGFREKNVCFNAMLSTRLYCFCGVCYRGSVAVGLLPWVCYAERAVVFEKFFSATEKKDDGAGTGSVVF